MAFVVLIAVFQDSLDDSIVGVSGIFRDALELLYAVSFRVYAHKLYVCDQVVAV